MNTRRVSLDVDEDLAAAIETLQGQGLSVVTADALRRVLEHEMHLRAGRRWIASLNDAHGHPTEQDYAWADEVLAEAMGPANGATGGPV